MHRLLALTLMISMSLAASASPAAAIGSLSVGDGVLYDDCRMHPYYFTVVPPHGTDSWSMDVTAYGPDGTSEAIDFVYDDISTGTGELQFCGWEMAGRYELVAEVEYTDYDARYGGTSTERLTSSFTMRQPYSRTRLRASTQRPRFGSVVRFVITSSDERPSGFFPSSYAEVRLQRKDGYRWVNVRRGRGYTDSQGREVLAFRWNIRGREVVRAQTVPSSDTAGSTSSPLTLRTI